MAATANLASSLRPETVGFAALLALIGLVLSANWKSIQNRGERASATRNRRLRALEDALRQPVQLGGTTIQFMDLIRTEAEERESDEKRGKASWQLRRSASVTFLYLWVVVLTGSIALFVYLLRPRFLSYFALVLDDFQIQ